MDSSDRPPESRIGVAMTGGGARVAYQAGVLRAISEMPVADPLGVICDSGKWPAAVFSGGLGRGMPILRLDFGAIRR
jgi:hypothetical protein